MKENAYCWRFFNAFNLYFCFVLMIFCSVMSALTFQKVFAPIQQLPFYNQSAIQKYVGLNQVSYAMFFHLPSFFNIQPQEIHVSASNYKLYECNISMITIQNMAESTKNITQNITAENISLVYNGIGKICFDKVQRTTQLQYVASRQPYEAIVNYSYCYQSLTDVVTINNLNKGEYNVTYAVPNVNFKQDGVKMCHQIYRGRPSYKSTIVAFMKKYDKDVRRERRWKWAQTGVLKLKYRQDEFFPDYWVHTSYAIASGIIFAMSLGFAIFYAVKQGFYQGFLFMK